MSVQDYQWFLSTDLADPLSTSRRNRYVVQPPNAGKQLVCRVIMSDRKDGTTAFADSAPTGVIAGLASVTIAQFSNAVSGSIGESLAGVTVDANLVRSGTTIATATATTDGSGGWSARLGSSSPGPIHGFDTEDSLAIHYSAPAADPDAMVPGDFTYVGRTFPTGQITADGTSIKVADEFGSDPCRVSRVLINGTSMVPVTSSSGCVVTPAHPINDSDDVRVQVSRRLFGTSGSAVVRRRARAGLVGGAAGPPTCSGDLVTGAVTCGPLTAGQFAIAQNGASPVPLVVIGSSGTATLPSLKPGDEVTLDETSPTPTTRHLTTLHVVRLRANLVDGAFASGICQPGEPFSANTICPSTGVTPAVSNPLRLIDDRSGGALTVTIPSLTDTIPNANASLSSGTFTSFVDLVGAEPANQLLAETQVVHLTIRPRGSQTPVVSRNMTPGSDSDGAFESVRVTGLTAGRYFADWVLRDVNGDTNTYESQFAVQGLRRG